MIEMTITAFKNKKIVININRVLNQNCKHRKVFFVQKLEQALSKNSLSSRNSAQTPTSF
jgi:hypothetical protein